MLAIRMQRTGRSGHAQFRLIVQEARRSPKSGNIVAALGHYDPHSKTIQVNKEKASFYLEHGAQPSPRVAVLLKSEGVKLPKWVQLEAKKQKAIKNVEKLRRNRPAEAPTAEVEAPIEEAPVEQVAPAEESDAPAAAEAAPAEDVEPQAVEAVSEEAEAAPANEK